ncbi:hypothetical protein M8C21_001045 [Ambrosia artemisiifolia]|uniref:Ubiquitin carboxyl-terminal hydrolase n=1 Tax=Ambrosia artemisiifolia TaxID=4212 RepID=A0AAD5BS76_AMBAR|nr:hypothetical protein M8C21_001045 [Ambrosia artemisiifolia]
MESLAPFRRIEFNPAESPLTKNTNRVGSSGKKRDASELENGLDQELSFGITFRRIGAGLENLGNTCFLNSVLQCLTYTEPLAAYLQSGKHQVTCRKSGFCALCAIQKHVSRALQLSGRSLAPKDLVSNLRSISRTFRNSRQEDAHEYMVNLLESMHKCCLPNGVPIESQSAYDKSLVHKIFGGQLRSQVKCMQCNYCSNKFDPFLDLSLEILKADTLYKAFAQFTAKEQLDGGAKQYQCQQCKQKVKALKQLTVYKAPNVLTVHLKRFGCHMSGQKIDKKVHFGPTLDLKPFVTGPYDGDLKYTLYGVLVHAGWSTHSGHYYCFVRTSSGMWYSLDDNRVYQVSEKKVFEQKAYMLFYFKDTRNFPSKKTTDVHHKEKTVMNGAPSGSAAPRDTQMKTGLSNWSLNAQTPLKKTADVAQQKDNSIVMSGTPNGPDAPREAQVNTGLSNGSLNADISLATVGTERNCLSSVASKETQTNTILSNSSLNDQKSLVSGSTLSCSSAPKEAQMKTGLSDGSVNGQKSLAAVGTKENGLDPVAPNETQTNSSLSNGSLGGQKSSPITGATELEQTQTKETSESSAIAGTMIKAFTTGATELEQTQMKETSVSKRISEPSKTEDHTKEIGGGESSGGHSGGDGYVGATTALLKVSGLPQQERSMENKALGGITHNVELSDLPQKESSMEKKAIMGKPRKKVKNFLKCKLLSMKLSSNALLGTSLNQRKKKKHKRNKRVKNLAPENSVNEGSSSLVKSEAQETVKPLVDDGFKPRVIEDGSVLATSDFNSRSQSNSTESHQLENCRRSLSQKALIHMLTRGIDERTVPQWDEDESASSQIFREERPNFAIGYTGDKWDEEYDRGKRKKVRISKTEFDGKNPFQDIANERLKSHSEKQNVSKRKNKHFKKPRSGNGPYRI